MCFSEHSHVTVNIIYMLVTIHGKSTYGYGHHHTSIGSHNCIVIFYNTVLELLNIGPHTGMVWA